MAITTTIIIILLIIIRFIFIDLIACYTVTIWKQKGFIRYSIKYRIHSNTSEQWLKLTIIGI